MYNFEQLVAGQGSGHYDTAAVTMGNTGLYFNRPAAAMITLVESGFTQVLIQVDQKDWVIGFHFNKISNRVRGNYKIGNNLLGPCPTKGFGVNANIQKRLPAVWKFVTNAYPDLATCPAFALKPCRILGTDFYVIDLKEKLNDV